MQTAGARSSGRRIRGSPLSPLTIAAYAPSRRLVPCMRSWMHMLVRAIPRYILTSAVHRSHHSLERPPSIQRVLHARGHYLNHLTNRILRFNEAKRPRIAWPPVPDRFVILCANLRIDNMPIDPPPKARHQTSGVRPLHTESKQRRERPKPRYSGDRWKSSINIGGMPDVILQMIPRLCLTHQTQNDCKSVEVSSLHQDRGICSKRSGDDTPFQFIAEPPIQEGWTRVALKHEGDTPLGRRKDANTAPGHLEPLDLGGVRS